MLQQPCHTEILCTYSLNIQHHPGTAPCPLSHHAQTGLNSLSVQHPCTTNSLKQHHQPATAGGLNIFASRPPLLYFQMNIWLVRNYVYIFDCITPAEQCCFSPTLRGAESVWDKMFLLIQPAVFHSSLLCVTTNIFNVRHQRRQNITESQN